MTSGINQPSARIQRLRDQFNQAWAQGALRLSYALWPRAFPALAGAAESLEQACQALLAAATYREAITSNNNASARPDSNLVRTINPSENLPRTIRAAEEASRVARLNALDYLETEFQKPSERYVVHELNTLSSQLINITMRLLSERAWMTQREAVLRTWMRSTRNLLQQVWGTPAERYQHLTEQIIASAPSDLMDLLQ